MPRLKQKYRTFYGYHISKRYFTVNVYLFSYGLVMHCSPKKKTRKRPTALKFNDSLALILSTMITCMENPFETLENRWYINRGQWERKTNHLSLWIAFQALSETRKKNTDQNLTINQFVNDNVNLTSPLFPKNPTSTDTQIRRTRAKLIEMNNKRSKKKPVALWSKATIKRLHITHNNTVRLARAI